MDKFISCDFNNISFEYSSDGVKTTPDFIIPPKLYKYYSLSEHNVDALYNNWLYAAHSYQLNDSLDSSDKIFDCKDIHASLYGGYYKLLLKERYIESEILELYKKDKHQNFQEFRETFVSSLSNSFGNISFTKNNGNILMWSHYTQEAGFCIEFETDLLMEYKQVNSDIKNIFFRPMQYVKKIELLNLGIQNFKGNRVPFFYMTTVKDKRWDYEKEYRLTIFKKDMDVPFNKRNSDIKNHKGKDDRFFRYNKNAINSITLGQNFFCNAFFKIKDDTFEIKISKESEHIENFINLLYDHYNDRIFFMGETPETGFLEKGITQIFFDRISLNKFKCHTSKKGFLL